jgi:hypothetical protein
MGNAVKGIKGFVSRPIEERFWEKIVVAPSGCWLWQGAKNRTGYGQLWRDGGLVVAHRVSYELFIGLVPGGLELDHLCRTPACVNPLHVEPVTHRENMLRGENPVSRAAKATHCPQGHGYTMDNTYVTPLGHRRCMACQRERARSHYALASSSAV